MKELVKSVKENIGRYTMILVALFIVIVFQILTKGMVLKPMNLNNLIIQNAYIIILAVGQMMLVLAGGLTDLSVGQLCSMSGCIAGLLIIKNGLPVGLSLLIDFLIVLAVGLWNASLVASLGIEAYIATLASQLIVKGVNYVVMQGKTYTMFPDSFLNWCTGHIPDFFGVKGLHVTSLILGTLTCLVVVILQLRSRKQKIAYNVKVSSAGLFWGQQALICAFIMGLTYLLAIYRGYPKILVIVVVIVAIYSFIVSKTIFGRQVVAVGGNRQAAVLSGIKDKKVIFLIYLNSALTAGFSGIIYAARLNACSLSIGLGLEADAICACFIGGGVSNGSIVGSLIGALVIGLLNNGMSLLGLGSDMQMVMKGLVLVFAVSLDIFQSRRSA